MSKLKNYINKNIKSEFVRNVLTIFTGVSFAQIIPIIISPLLTRLYTPADFAILGLFTSTAMLFSNIATLSYDQAIMLPKKNSDAVNIMALSVICVIGVTLLSAVVVVVFNNQLTGLMKNPALKMWLYFVPIAVFLGGMFKILNVWASRQKQFKRLAMRNITQTAITGGTKLLFGVLKLTNLGLVVGTLTGQAAATGLLAWQTKNDKIKLQDISKSGIKKNAVTYKKFPLYTNWQSFGDVINTTGSKYIISNIFGATILGWFSFTYGLLQRPLQIIGQSVSQVFYQRISEDYNQDRNLWPLIRKIIVRLFWIGLIIFLPLAFLGPQIFKFIFGENWTEAGKYAQLMVPWLFSKFVFSPVSSVPLVLNKQHTFFIITLTINILVPVSFYLIGTIYNNIYYALIINSIIVFVIMMVFLFWIKKLTNIKFASSNFNI